MDETQNNDQMNQDMGTDAGAPAAGDMNGDQAPAAPQENGGQEGDENAAAA